ncbi:MAG: hypothetical protein K2Y08_04485 [Alphaproteobacteria bacterium]|nr:hypothetical protein [Alphaproteobacteria bacterium]
MLVCFNFPRTLLRFRGNDNLYDSNAVSSSTKSISTSSWIAAVSSRHNRPFSTNETEAYNDDEAGICSSLQKVKVEESRQELETPMASMQLSWFTELLLLGLLFFCRIKSIMPYPVKNILTHKGAENMNIPGYLRDVA